MRIDLRILDKASGKNETIILYPDIHVCSIVDLDGDGEPIRLRDTNREEVRVLVRDLVGHDVLVERIKEEETLTLAEGLLKAVDFDLTGSSFENE